VVVERTRFLKSSVTDVRRYCVTVMLPPAGRVLKAVHVKQS